MTIKRALISVSNKTGIIEFAHHLATSGIEILATGGTASLLHQNNIPVTDVSDYTDFPEIMGGRVKTLHPKIYGGLLHRPGIDDAVMLTHEIKAFDLVVVNLYPFEEVTTQKQCSFDQAIENIDIGGTAMLRAAAKNHESVTVLVDPEDYQLVWEQIKATGQTPLSTRRHLAQKAFAQTARYDQAIALYFQDKESKPFPDLFCPKYHKKIDLRYGENPHQAAALYGDPDNISGTLASARLLQGKPLSYNNLLDSDAALNCVRAFDDQASVCAIIKHGTPCAVAQATTLLLAYQQALSSDPESAFGGIIAFNQPISAATAEEIIKQPFAEVVLAPAVLPEALSILNHKPNWRILACGSKPVLTNVLALRSISGGLLVQEEDCDLEITTLSIPTRRQPEPNEWQDLKFAWKVVQFVKSNAIVYAKDQTTLGIGGGQTSRVFSAEIGALKAQKMKLSLIGSVAASDAFFPFADGIEMIAAHGVRAIIQPGGSKRDQEVIAAADKHGIAMILTGVRHFRH